MLGSFIVLWLGGASNASLSDLHTKLKFGGQMMTTKSNKIL